MSSLKKLDFFVLILLALLGIPTVIFFHANFLASTLVFLGAPSAYLLIRKTQNLKIIYSGVFLIGILLGFGFDFLATFNNSWLIPDSQLTIHYRIFGAAPVDEIICLILWTLLMLLVYEHFFERKRVEKLHIRHFVYAGIVPAFLTIVFILASLHFRPSLITFGYAYLVLGSLATLPLIYFIFHNPKLLGRVIKPAPYFIFLYLTFELTSLYLKQWSFSGQYIGHIQLLSFSFPLEELFFWIIVSSTVVLADYKMLVDTDK